MSTTPPTAGPERNTTLARNRTEEEILRAVRAVRYGSVEIVIHDARVVQVERREKVRFQDDSPATASVPPVRNRPTTPVTAKNQNKPTDRPGPTGTPDAPRPQEIR